VTPRSKSLKLDSKEADGLARLVPMPGGGERARKGQRCLGVQGHADAGCVVFDNLEDGMTIDEVAEQFPVTREQIKAVLEFAGRSLDAPLRGR
jgi:hypothetical protein